MNIDNLVQTIIRKAFTPIRKNQPTSSNVHVSVPLGSDQERRIRKDSTMNPPINNLEATMINAAYGKPVFPASGAANAPRPAQPIGKPGDKTSPIPAKPGNIKTDGPPKTTDGDPGTAPGKANAAKPPESPVKKIIRHEGGKYILYSHKGKVLGRFDSKAEAEKHEREVQYFKHVDKAGDEDVHPTQAPEGGRRVATLAVMHGPKLLMGKRRDNGKWTTPGGHVEDGEDMHSGALRELHEETGMTRLKKRHIKPLSGIHKLADREGKPLHVQPFKVETEKRHNTTMKNDPDGEVERWHWVDTSKGLPEEIQSNLHVPGEYNCLLQALGLVVAKDMTEINQLNVKPNVDKDDAGNTREMNGDGTNNTLGLYDMQQIIAGTDWELSEPNTGLDASSAKELALSNLQDDPDYYRKKYLQLNNPDDEPQSESTKKDTRQTQQSSDSGMGLNLDLGSGQAREPGHIGVDLYPYDHGTIVHDVNLGLPFEDGSAQNVRLVNSLHEMDGLSDDPKPLLAEIQRVLMPGGQFHYEGPNQIYNYPEWLNETEHETSVAKGNEGVPEWHKQTFTRAATPDAATANDTEPRIGISQYDNLPADALLAMDALGYYWSDATTSGRGNRLHGYPSQGALVQKNKEQTVKTNKGLVRKDFVPIMKMNKAKQIVYGVVLSPDELDLQDDIMGADDIEKTAHEYLEKHRVVGSSHEKPISAFPVESYIAPQDMEWTDSQYGPQKIKKGAWVLGVKIIDPKEWQKVINGDYAGFSVGGMGLRDPISSGTLEEQP